MHSVNCVEDVLGLRDVCRSLDAAPHNPVGGSPAAPTFNEKLQVDLSFSGCTIALRVMYISPEFPPFFYPFVWRASEKFGMPFADCGFGFLSIQCVSGWVKGRNGRMRRGRIFVRRG